MVDSFLEVDQLIISDEVGDNEKQISPYNIRHIIKQIGDKNYYQKVDPALLYHQVL